MPNVTATNKKLRRLSSSGIGWQLRRRRRRRSVRVRKIARPTAQLERGCNLQELSADILKIIIGAELARSLFGFGSEHPLTS
jgi:hypothetical protein